ncbi:MAG: phosphatidate cytidylyltransferase [Gemmatimonadales bacterium]|nr:MAG: phosphatidate cytidylyltransferase [Gemmatimonadales bacterium]
MSRDLGLRLTVAAVGIPFGFAVVWAGGPWLAVFATLLALLGTEEVLHLARSGGQRPFGWIALPASALLVLAAWFAGTYVAWAPLAVLIILLAAASSLLASVFLRRMEEGPLPAIGSTLLAILYAGAPFAFAVFLRDHPAGDWTAPGWDGVFLLVFALTVTWLGDSAAYFGGRAMGRRKLLPAVSPKKTVEGALSGLVGASAGAALMVAFLLPVWGSGLTLSVTGGAILGALLGMAAQVGDLAESLLKREAGVKDSGRILPGHGGVLDRFVGVLFSLRLT